MKILYIYFNWSPFSRLTGNNVTGHYFCHFSFSPSSMFLIEGVLKSNNSFSENDRNTHIRTSNGSIFFTTCSQFFNPPPPQGRTLGVFDTFSYLANFIGCNQPAEILSKHYIYIWVPHYISQMCPWNQYSIRKEKNKVKINQSVYYLKNLLMISAYCLSSYPGKKFNVAKTTYSYLRQS